MFEETILILEKVFGEKSLRWTSLNMLLPQFYGGGVVKMYTIQRHRQENVHKKAIQTKIHLYIKKYIIKKYCEYSKYSSSNGRVYL